MTLLLQIFQCLGTDNKRAENSTIYVNVWIMQIDIKLDLPPPDCTFLYSLVKILFFSLSFLALLSTSTFLCKNSTDCQSLLKFKQGITGDPDGHLQDWNETMFFCNWTGITCHQQLKNRVIAIELINMRLEGVISPYISNLSHLTTLSLQANSLYGGIPATIGELSDLETIDLDYTNLTGSIPAVLGQMTNLTYLCLSQNSLTGAIPSIPASISNCTALRHITLFENRLTGTIPLELGSKLHNLQRLYFQQNQLSGKIPVTLSNLSQLTLLDLSLNQLEGEVPPELGKLKKLERLYLHSNNLVSDLPAEIGNLSGLVTLDLCGTIPSSLGNLSQLRYLYLSHNHLTGKIPIQLTQCSLLMLLDLSFNNLQGLTGEVPNSGRYKNLGSGSFMGNMGLCGGTKLMGLHPCEIQKQKHKKRKWIYYLVYKAIINDGKTVVAVKVLQEECVQGYRSFKRECQILSEIRHRNLVRMIGSTWNSGFKAIVLEYIGNGNLEQHLYPGGSDEGGSELKLRERMGIAIDVANGLEYLHEGCPVQVVHCDLKPQNVLLDNDMVAHVADFGIGKLISGDKPRGHVTTTTAFLRGSVGYIPPEYGQGIDVSTRGDVYSFGVMMLEMITRKRPTNEMFSDGLDLRKWVCSAFPNQVLDIVDISLKHEAYLEEGSGALHKLEQCCIHMLDAGMMCTEENPQKRPLISSVAQRLKNVWKEMGFGTLYMAKEENVDMSLNSK
ncbi:unnamed protein product, partial [Vitis vinifera]